MHFLSALAWVPILSIASLDLNAQTFTLETSWPQPNGLVYAMFLDEANGILYIGGDFTMMGTEPRTRLAAIDVANGNLTDWAPSANGAVRAMALHANEVLVGGQFSIINGTARARLASINATTGALLPWDPGANLIVWCIAADSDRIVVGGEFTTLGGMTRNRIAAFDATTGTLTAWDPDASAAVRDVQLLNSDAIIGGAFTTVSGQARASLAMVDAAGLTTAWAPSANGMVTDLTVTPTSVFVCGPFTQLNGTARPSLGEVLLSDGSLTTWSSLLEPTTQSIAVQGDWIAAGGTFEHYNGGPQPRLAVLDASTGTLIPGSPNTNSTVSDLVLTPDLLVACGAFTQVNGLPWSHLAAFSVCHPQTWYEDVDEDGFGNAASTFSACTAPVGYVGNDDDCDDLDASIGAGTTWYVDADGDEWGDPNNTIIACEQPVGTQDNGLDCDDSDPAIAPSEACEDNDPFTIGDLLRPYPECGCRGKQLVISAKAFLQGPYDPGTGLMRDDLRVAGLIPISEPYTSLGYLPGQFSIAGGDVTTPAVLAVIGPNAIVDWVILEVRANFDGELALSTRYALIQRDGDIVEPDGQSPVRFPRAPTNYRLAVVHRNHMGVLESQPEPDNGSYYEVSTRDFSSPALTVYGQNSRIASGPVLLLRAGDTSFNDEVRYVGQDNDRDPILVRVGGTVPTNIVFGYYTEDVNMDGVVRYGGQNNDRDPILQTVGGSDPYGVRPHVYRRPTY